MPPGAALRLEGHARGIDIHGDRVMSFVEHNAAQQGRRSPDALMREARISVVRKGEVVRVLDRNRPVAHIVPIAEKSISSAGAEVLADLERKGLIRRGSGRIAPEILARDPPPGKPCGVLAALLEERDSR